jgi:hypothetical protein
MPALAQTPQEAAAINARLAIELCARNYRTPDEIRPAFEAAGFAYTAEDFGGGPGDVLHWYAAPADTVSTAVLFPGPDQAECRVTTDHMDVAEALPFARAVFETMFAGPRSRTAHPRGRTCGQARPKRRATSARASTSSHRGTSSGCSSPAPETTARARATAPRRST